MKDILILLAFAVGFVLIFLFAIWLESTIDSGDNDDEFYD